MKLKLRSLLVQVLAVNLLLVATTVVVITVALSTDWSDRRGSEVLVLGLAVVATLLGNWVLLRRRLEPLEAMISTMEEVDLSEPENLRPVSRRSNMIEVRRLQAAFARMIARLAAERREAGRAAIEAQERERQRIARDLHDEVNQALTAVSLRLQASIEQAPAELREELAETKRLCGQAMEELLVLARQLRPAVLDDHGLLAALNSQVRDFAQRSAIAVDFRVNGQMPELTPEQQLAIYRVTQESLSNVVRHAEARTVEVELTCEGATKLRISDDGRGFLTPRNGGLGLPGMRERALLAGGQLAITSDEQQGTQVELTIP